MDRGKKETARQRFIDIAPLRTSERKENELDTHGHVSLTPTCRINSERKNRVSVINGKKDKLSVGLPKVDSPDNRFRKINHVLGKANAVGLMGLDFSKTYDFVSHGKLLVKLETLVISRRIVR